MAENRRFRPKLLSSIFVFIGLGILIALGTWQLSRYNEKIVIENDLVDTSAMELVVVESAHELGELDGRKVRLMGQFESAPRFPHHVFKHRNRDGVPGFWIASMFIFPDRTKVLVNRGWFQRSLGIEVASELKFPKGAPVGLVHKLPRVIEDPKGRGEKCEPFCVWNTYDVPGAYLKSESEPSDVVIVLGEESSVSPVPIAGYEYITQPYLTADRHLGYVATWYGMAAALFLLWFAAGFGFLGRR